MRAKRTKNIASFFLQVIAFVLGCSPFQTAWASDDLASISSKVVTLQRNHGEVTWFGFYFLAERFGDGRHSHFYPNMTKAYWDFKTQLLGQGKYVWAFVEKEEHCRPTNWDNLVTRAGKLMEKVNRGRMYWEHSVPRDDWPSTFEEHWVATYQQDDRYKNPWSAKSYKVLSLCRKLRNFKKGELEFDAVAASGVTDNFLEKNWLRRLEHQARDSMASVFAVGKDLQLYGSPLASFVNIDKVLRPNERERSATEYYGIVFLSQRTADGDPTKPYEWKKGVSLLKLDTSTPKPPVLQPPSPSPSKSENTLVLTAKPSRELEWAEKMKQMWAESAARDAELASRVAQERARSKSDIGYQMDELTRQFCMSADADKACICRPKRVCSR